MNNIQKYINKYGEPDAIIDSWDSNSNKYMIWGFESICMYKNGFFSVDDVLFEGNPLDLLNDKIDNWSDNNDSKISALGFISYDFKNILFPHLNIRQTSSNPLFWFAKPKIIIEFKDENLSDFFNEDFGMELIFDIPNINNYKKAVSKIKTHLQNGDVYQINYTNPKKYKIDGNPLSIYSALRNIAEPNNGYYINTGYNYILSLSPESFFNVKNNIIETKPIKGTRKKYNNNKNDFNKINELKNSEKDKAEHLMIVDLLRNDLGKICEFDSINVLDLFNVESYKTIHHMVTKIKGELKSNITFSNIIKAMFPGGSITGAPKERAVEIIDSIEENYRNIYTGTIGHITDSHDMDFNIAIRTLIIVKGIGLYNIGGGIVWDSDPILEWEEANIKSNILNNILLK